MKKNIEKRYLKNEAEFRASKNEEGKYIIEGYALKFGVRSKDLGGFVEELHRNSLDGADMDDVLVRVNHQGDIQSVVGRSDVNLSLSIDDTGLFYRVELEESSARDMQLYNDINRGIIKSSSFAFRVAKEGDVWAEEGDTYVRTVMKISQIADVAPVHNPAYDSATVGAVSARSLESLETFKKTLEDRSKPEDDETISLKDSNIHIDDKARLRLLERN